MKARKYHVYSIYNKINKKRYIGLTKNGLRNRKGGHFRDKTPLGEDLRKYGWKNFSCKPLKRNLTKKQADQYERFYIDKYKCKVPPEGNGYNQTNGGAGTLNPTPETREKISKANIGNKNAQGKRTGEALQNILNSVKNQNHSEQTKKAWETRRKNGTDKRAPEAIKKGLETRRKNGTDKHTEKTKQKLSEKMQGNKNAVGHGAPKGSKNALGYKHTPEAIKRMSGENNHNYKPREKRYCACNCGGTFECKFDSNQRFIPGHNLRLKNCPQHRSGKNHPNYKHGKYVRKSSCL